MQTAKRLTPDNIAAVGAMLAEAIPGQPQPIANPAPSTLTEVAACVEKILCELAGQTGEHVPVSVDNHAFTDTISEGWLDLHIEANNYSSRLLTHRTIELSCGTCTSTPLMDADIDGDILALGVIDAGSHWVVLRMYGPQGDEEDQTGITYASFCSTKEQLRDAINDNLREARDTLQQMRKTVDTAEARLRALTA